MNYILKKQYYPIKNQMVKIHLILYCIQNKAGAFPSPMYVIECISYIFDKNCKYINPLVNDKEILEKYTRL